MCNLLIENYYVWCKFRYDLRCIYFDLVAMTLFSILYCILFSFIRHTHINIAQLNASKNVDPEKAYFLTSINLEYLYLCFFSFTNVAIL